MYTHRAEVRHIHACAAGEMQAERIGMQRSAVLGNVFTSDRTSSETTLLPRETAVRYIIILEQLVASIWN